MSQSFLIALERRTPRGWTSIPWVLPLRTRDGRESSFDPHGFYDRTFFYVLTSIPHRIDPDDCPRPLVEGPRGAPADLSPELAKAAEEETYLLHWLWASEVLRYDWDAYERFLVEQHLQFERRYQARNGRPSPHPGSRQHAWFEVIDVVAALEPIEDHRLILGME
ncbi:MAG: hypothetical protein KDK70_04445 [Myxococcales bacterium]|nr:hypothetical protein [Myxococcales bacterium]